jgi:hypothetical protein
MDKQEVSDTLAFASDDERELAALSILDLRAEVDRTRAEIALDAARRKHASVNTARNTARGRVLDNAVGAARLRVGISDAELASVAGATGRNA